MKVIKNFSNFKTKLKSTPVTILTRKYLKSMISSSMSSFGILNILNLTL